MFKIAALVFVVWLKIANSCFGGFGSSNGEDGSISDYAITSSPNFELSYYPLVAWTTPVTGTTPTPFPGSANSLDEATKNAQQTVKSALIEALVDNNVQLSSTVRYDVSNIIATEINAKSTSATTIAAGDGLVESGVVTKKCSGNPTNISSCTEDYFFPRMIRLKNGPLIAGKQWKDVGNSLQNLLTLRGLKFKDAIIVTE